MVKKSPFADKVTAGNKTAIWPASAGRTDRDTLSQAILADKKNAQIRKDAGRSFTSAINAWSTEDACALCADRPSYAQLHGHRE